MLSSKDWPRRTRRVRSQQPARRGRGTRRRLQGEGHESKASRAVPRRRAADAQAQTRMLQNSSGRARDQSIAGECRRDALQPEWLFRPHSTALPSRLVLVHPAVSGCQQRLISRAIDREHGRADAHPERDALARDAFEYHLLDTALELLTFVFRL